MSLEILRLTCDYSSIERGTLQHIQERPEDSSGNLVWPNSCPKKVILKVEKIPALGSINVIRHRYLLIDDEVVNAINSANLNVCPSVKWVPVELSEYNNKTSFSMPLNAASHEVVDRAESDFQCYEGTSKIYTIDKFVLGRLPSVQNIDLFFTELGSWFCSGKFKSFSENKKVSGCNFSPKLGRA